MSSPRPDPAGRPNIVLIITDHTNAAAVAPSSQCLTPNLDALAAEGVRFARCYTTNAICSPARASLMTGLYPSTHGMWDCTHTQRAEWVDVPAERFTYFSSVLAEAGYRNGYFGKWHVEQSNKLENFGWHEYELCGRVSLAADPDTAVTVDTPGYRQYRLAAVATDGETPAHPAFDRGIDFLARQAGSDRPFCCVVSTIEPHDTYVAPKRFFDLYDLDAVRVSPTLRDDLAGKPEVLKRMQAVWAELSEADWRMISAAYWAVISYLDHELGRLIEALKRNGQYDNTVIVFTSDHGDMLGAHGLATKGVGTAYEEVYNIPLIVRAPGACRCGEDTATCTSLIDLAPTLLELAAAPALPDAQGRSLVPVLAGTHDPADWADAYAEFFGQRFVYTQRITWHGPWKYIFSPGGIDELYNLADDPHEMNNLAADPAHRATLEAMVARMWRKMAAIGDKSLYNTHYATLRTAPIGPLASEDG